jgi:hypothetical protein
MSDAGDLGRNEAQRQALSGVLARFTADRDNLLAAIQSCQQRVTELVERLGGDPSASASDDVGKGETLASRIATLEARVELLEREVRTLTASAGR